MKTHETKNWSELAMILTARLRLQYICTGAADKRCAAFLMEIMQRSGEADPAAALSYMVMADSAAGDDVLQYWTALYERGRIFVFDDELDVEDVCEFWSLLHDATTLSEEDAVKIAEQYGILQKGGEHEQESEP